jgi:hypothetical protein
MDEIDFSQDGINHINIINFLLAIKSWNDSDKMFDIRNICLIRIE